MAVGSRQEDRIVRRGLVQVPPSREYRRVPESLDPSATSQPIARLGVRDSRFDFSQKIFEARSPFQVEVHLAEPDAGEMVMRVYKTGHDRRAFQVDDLHAFALVFLGL